MATTVSSISTAHSIYEHSREASEACEHQGDLGEAIGCMGASPALFDSSEPSEWCATFADGSLLIASNGGDVAWESLADYLADRSILSLEEAGYIAS